MTPCFTDIWNIMLQENAGNEGLDSRVCTVHYLHVSMLTLPLICAFLTVREVQLEISADTFEEYISLTLLFLVTKSSYNRRSILLYR